MWQGDVKLGDRHIQLESGEIAKQSNGAVVVRDGDTVLLVTVVAASEARAGASFFPLTVDYRERFSSTGRFPGGYRKREGRTTDLEVLSCRLIDRTIRPLFPDRFRVETQVLATVMSYDTETDPEALAITGAAAALHVSDVPWSGPIAGVRVAMVDGAPKVMPSPEERERATIDFIVSAGRDGLAMVEGLAREASESEVIDCLMFAESAVAPLLDLQDQLRQSLGAAKREFTPPALPEHVVTSVRSIATDALDRATQIADKGERRAAIAEVRRQVDAAIEDPASESTDDGMPAAEAAALVFDEILHDVVRHRIAGASQRIDGRALDAVRPISGRVGWLPRVHGSAIFTRGETQALVSCTLGTTSDEQENDAPAGKTRDRFYLHYSFPPYSVGETRPVRGPGRREIGHGALAQRALAGVIPYHATYPYTIRIESEISESNGSSSMASVCGGCLAMMDAGVPIVRPVAGIAMGLIQEGESIAILSDILGDEDHLGDMDFKVAGTSEGITAVQMDNKVGSLPRDILASALEQARRGRLHILDEMAKVLDSPRTAPPGHAPRIAVEKIRRNRIRELIGPGGAIIQRLQQETETQINVEQDGTVQIFAPRGASIEAARERVRKIAGEPKVGATYTGEITGVKDFGCFVRVMGAIEGLVHVSELGSVEGYRTGAKMAVKVLGVDEQGKLKLSHREAETTPA